MNEHLFKNHFLKTHFYFYIEENLNHSENFSHYHQADCNLNFFFKNNENRNKNKFKVFTYFRYLKKNSRDIFCSKLVSNISATDTTIIKKLKIRKTKLAEQQALIMHQ